MKPKTIILVLVICVVLIGLFAWGYAGKGGTAASVQGVSSTKASQSKLVASEMVYDFGSISMKNGKVTKVFKVTNPTDQDVEVNDIMTSCMCTTAFLETSTGEKGPFGMAGHGGPMVPVDEIIKAGESRDFKVVYDPNAHGPSGVGQIDRFVTLTDVTGAKLDLEIKAVVTP